MKYANICHALSNEAPCAACGATVKGDDKVNGVCQAGDITKVSLRHRLMDMRAYYDRIEASKRMSPKSRYFFGDVT